MVYTNAAERSRKCLYQGIKAVTILYITVLRLLCKLYSLDLPWLCKLMIARL